MNEVFDFVKNNRGILVQTSNSNIHNTNELRLSRAKNQIKKDTGLRDVGRGIVNFVINEGNSINSIAAINQISQGALRSRNTSSSLQIQVARSFGSLINETANQTRQILPNIQRISDISELSSGIAIGERLSLNNVARRLIATSPELGLTASQIPRGKGDAPRGIGIEQDILVGGIAIAKAGEPINKFIDNPDQVIKNLGQELANAFPNLVNLAVGMISEEIKRIIQGPMRMAANVVQQFYELQELVSTSADLFSSVAGSIKKLFSGELTAKDLFNAAKKTFGEISNSIDIVNILQSEIQRFADFAKYIKQLNINKKVNERNVKSILGE
jgi:hypothetical protein